MIHSYQRIKRILPLLNEAELTVEDFQKVIDTNKIGLIELRLKQRGYHFFDLITRESWIVLKKGLEYLKYLETLAHEFFHACLGCSEFEANAFRLLALIPQSALMNFDWLEANPSKYAYKLWRERQRLFFLYQM